MEQYQAWYTIKLKSSWDRRQQLNLDLRKWQAQYASMADPNEGNSQKFIPSALINGTKLAKIGKKDVNLSQPSNRANRGIC